MSLEVPGESLRRQTAGLSGCIPAYAPLPGREKCISEWENGNMEPTLSNLIKLADYFETSIDFLAGRIEY